jgi:transcriptional regulator with XRE-family HTH domain
MHSNRAFILETSRKGVGLGRTRSRLVQRRKALGLSQEGLAEAVGVDRSTAARWERGETSPQPWHLSRLAHVLDTSAEDVAELLADADHHATSPEAAARPPEPSDASPFTGLLGTPPSPDEHPQNRLHQAIDHRNATAYAERLLRHFLAVEAELGGDRLYASLARHVDALASTVDQLSRPSLLSAFGQLCQMTGWLALDANRHQVARRYLCTAVLAGHQADEPALAASALAYMSLQEVYRDHPGRALALARTGCDVAAGSGTPRLDAGLGTRIARAHARAGNRQEAVAALGRADEAFARSGDPESEPVWLSYVDQREILAQSGACYLDLGLHRQATAALSSALRLLDQQSSTNVRDRVHYLSRLAKCHLLAGDLDQACAAAHEALDLGQGLGSARVLERIGEFHAALAPHAAYREVRVFRDRFSAYRPGQVA